MKMNLSQFRLLEAILNSLKMSTDVDIISHEGVFYRVSGRNSQKPYKVNIETRPIWCDIEEEFLFARNKKYSMLVLERGSVPMLVGELLPGTVQALCPAERVFDVFRPVEGMLPDWAKEGNPLWVVFSYPKWLDRRINEYGVRFRSDLLVVRYKQVEPDFWLPKVFLKENGVERDLEDC